MYTITLVNSNITLIYKSIITDPALYSDSFNGVFVSVWALASALGRVNIGYLSQSVYNTNGRKISVWHPLPFISVAMAVACAVQMYMYRCICIFVFCFSSGCSSDQCPPFVPVFVPNLFINSQYYDNLPETI